MLQYEDFVSALSNPQSNSEDLSSFISRFPKVADAWLSLASSDKKTNLVIAQELRDKLFKLRVIAAIRSKKPQFKEYYHLYKPSYTCIRAMAFEYLDNPENPAFEGLRDTYFSGIVFCIADSMGVLLKNSSASSAEKLQPIEDYIKIHTILAGACYFYIPPEIMSLYTPQELHEVLEKLKKAKNIKACGYLEYVVSTQIDIPYVEKVRCFLAAAMYIHAYQMQSGQNNSADIFADGCDQLFFNWISAIQSYNVGEDPIYSILEKIGIVGELADCLEYRETLSYKVSTYDNKSTVFEGQKRVVASKVLLLIACFCILKDGADGFVRRVKESPEIFCFLTMKLIKKATFDNWFEDAFNFFILVLSTDILKNTKLFAKNNNCPTYMHPLVLQMVARENTLSPEHMDKWKKYTDTVRSSKSRSKNKLFKDSDRMQCLIETQALILDHRQLSELHKQTLLIKAVSCEDPMVFLQCLKHLAIVDSSILLDIVKDVNNLELNILRSMLCKAYDIPRAFIDLCERYKNLYDFLIYMLNIHKSSLKFKEELISLCSELLGRICASQSVEYYAMRRDLRRNKHLNEVLAKRPDLKDLWFQGGSKDIENGFRIVDTDDWYLLMMAGTDVSGSCQHLTAASPSTNQALLGYLCHGHVRMYAVLSLQGNILARCMVRLVLTESGDNVVILKEDTYKSEGPGNYENVLNEYALERAQELKCDLVESTLSRMHDNATNGVYCLKAFAPYDYSDAGGGTCQRGAFYCRNVKYSYKISRDEEKQEYSQPLIWSLLRDHSLWQQYEREEAERMLLGLVRPAPYL